MLPVYDLAHQGSAAAAACAGATVLGDLRARASTALNAGSDLSVGDAVAVADDHFAAENETSLLKVIVKVIS